MGFLPLFLASVCIAGRLDRSIEQALVLTLGAWAAVRVGAWKPPRYTLLWIATSALSTAFVCWIALQPRKQDEPFREPIRQASELESVGRLSEAAGIYASLLQHAPASPELHFALGRACLLQGRREQARIHLQEVLRLSPEGSPWSQPSMALLVLAGTP